MSKFLAILWREQITFWCDDYNVCFVQTNTLSWISLVFAHWKNNQWKDILLYLDTLSRGKTYGSTWTHYPVERHMALPGHIIPWKDIWLYLDTLSCGKTYGSTWTHYPVERHIALPGHIIPWKDIWLYLDTLSWFRVNQFLLLLLNTVYLEEKQQIASLFSLLLTDGGSNILSFFGLTDSGSNIRSFFGLTDSGSNIGLSLVWQTVAQTYSLLYSRWTC
jgi:hypothetical protein